MDRSVKLTPQGVLVRPDPHSDRPAVSFLGTVGRPGTPCGEVLPRRCCDPRRARPFGHVTVLSMQSVWAKLSITVEPGGSSWMRKKDQFVASSGASRPTRPCP